VGGMHIDLTAITAILMGGILLLVPLAGVTLRYGVVPLLATIGELRAAGRLGGTGADLRRHLREMEDRIGELELALDAREGGRKSA
jgi:hypothetical protein